MAAKKQTSIKSRSTSSSRRTPVTRRKVVKSDVPAQGASLLDYFRFGESYTSLVLGIVVVIFATVLLLSFFKTRTSQTTTPQRSTSSSKTVNEQGTPDKTPQGEITEKNDQDERTYTVKAGDDLWKIAEAHYNDGYKWVEIAKANNLSNPGVINVGNKLILPTDKTTSQATTATEKQSVDQAAPKAEITKEAATSDRSINDKSYVIQTGDDLWDIAVRAYGDGYRWVEIARVNNLADPNLIHSGNTLQLPR